MENPIPISYLNDFTFCPVSIYFHNLMEGQDDVLTQTHYQLNGKSSHHSVDSGTYSSRKDILQGMTVYSERYGLIGKIDVFDNRDGTLIERKKKISRIFDGHIFQLYAQYYCLAEMGYNVKRLRIHSMDDNKTTDVPLPSQDIVHSSAFDRLIEEIHGFTFDGFYQNNREKCEKCIYSVMCSFIEVG